MCLDILDCYGLAEIKSSKSDRSAHVEFTDGEWCLYLYWIEDDLVMENNRTGFTCKREAMQLGENWVKGHDK